MEQLVWFSNPSESNLINNKYENFLLESLKAKYGMKYNVDRVPSTFVASNGYETNLETIETKWESDGLVVKLKKVIETRMNFIKLILEYSLSDSYLERYKKTFDEWKKQESAF